jgi:hypothetical protein
VLCAAVVPAYDVVRARRVMRELTPRNRRRLHVHDEGAASRRRILAEFRRSEPVAAAHLWIARIGGRPARTVRDECFRDLVPGVLELGATRIVVESCSQDAQDRRHRRRAREPPRLGTVRYDVVPAATDELVVGGRRRGMGVRRRRSLSPGDRRTRERPPSPVDARRPGDPSRLAGSRPHFRSSSLRQPHYRRSPPPCRRRFSNLRTCARTAPRQAQDLATGAPGHLSSAGSPQTGQNEPSSAGTSPTRPCDYRRSRHLQPRDRS